MTELIPTQQDEKGDVLVTGRDLHEFLGVKTTYTQWFARMTDYGFVENVDFIVITKNVNDDTSFGGVRKKTDHHIKIPMAKEISMIQRNEKGKQARQYFIEVEQMWNSPEMIVQRALKIQEHKIYQLEGQIKRDEPYTNFGKIVSTSDASVNIGSFAKIMYDHHGLRIGRNKMFKWLRGNGYLIRSGREWNQPKQRYLEQGLFETTVTIISRTHGDVESVTTMVTGKGQLVLSKKLLEDYGVTTT